MSGVLAEIIEFKKKASELEEEIKRREAEAGIPELREELELLNESIKLAIEQSVNNGIYKEGSIQIIDTPRNVRKVRVRDFQAAYPNILWDVVEVKVMKAEAALLDMYKSNGMDVKQAKERVKEEMEALCDVNVTHSYKIIDVLEGV